MVLWVAYDHPPTFFGTGGMHVLLDCPLCWKFHVISELAICTLGFGGPCILCPIGYFPAIMGGSMVDGITHLFGWFVSTYIGGGSEVPMFD